MSNAEDAARRVVITGMGILSPIGVGAEAFWEGLATGRAGVGKISQFECHAVPGQIGGECKEFTDETAKKLYLKDQRKSLKVMCRDIQLGVASANLAIEHSGLDVKQAPQERMGVEFGANLMVTTPQSMAAPNKVCQNDDREFEPERWGQEGLRAMEPLWLLKYLPNMPACHIGIQIQARGPSNSITLDDASSNLAIKEAQAILLRDRADIMIVGTSGSSVHPHVSLHSRMWDQLAYDPDDPAGSMRPFDKDRSGQVIGEGACTLILEEEQFARGRGATIYGQVLGGGASCVIDRQGRPNFRAAIANAIRSALKMAHLEPRDIGHINANGVATQEGDLAEAQAIHDVFGELGRQVPVTALKGYLGDSGAGCGMLEIAGSLLGLRHGLVPATRNYRTPDPAVDLNIVHGAPLPVSNKIFLNINYTRMAQASVVVAEGL